MIWIFIPFQIYALQVFIPVLWADFLKVFLYLAASGLSGSTCSLHRVLWELLLWCRLPFVVVQRLSSCSTWALEHEGSVAAELRLSYPEVCGILVPWPGIEPESLALQGRLLITGPPGKSPILAFRLMIFFNLI